jgi:hypothetical protein
MFTVKDFIARYRDYSEEELIGIYHNIDGYSNEAKEALNTVIDERGGLEKLLKNLADRKVIADEQARIAKEAFELGTQGVDPSLIKTLATSGILSADKVNEIIEQKYSEVEAEKADKAVTSRTIVGSIVGGLIASIVGGIIWGLQMVYSHRIINMVFVVLVLLCYWIIKIATRQTIKNKAVIIATVLSIILALLIGQAMLATMGFAGLRQK